jgi:hypothetical protein
MKKLQIKSIHMLNFKGIKNLDIEFNINGETNIHAANRVGKTTLADAIPFVFFGKNAADQTKFGVKTNDKNGVVIPHLDHSVRIHCLVDGVEEVFERQIVEKWVKQHGETTKTYKGDETKLFINAAPKTLSEYNREVAAIIDPAMFKLLSNPLEFNRLKWEERRGVLIAMAGEIDETKVLDSVITVANKGDYNGLINLLNAGKSIETYKSELKGKIKLINDDLIQIPGRISEADHNKPAVLDWSTIQAQIAIKKGKLVEIDGKLQDGLKKIQSENLQQQEALKLIGQKKIELQEIENNAKLEANKDLAKNKLKVSELELELDKLNESGGNLDEIISGGESKQQTLEAEKAVLLTEYKAIKDSTFGGLSKEQSICPTCKREFEDTESKYQELEGNFNVNKANLLEANKTKGIAKAKEITDLIGKIAKAKIDIEEVKKQIPIVEESIAKIDLREKPVDYSMNKEWNDVQDAITKMESDVKEIKEPDNSELKEQKAELLPEIEELQKQLNTKETIESADKRIAELTGKQNGLAQQIADLQKEESAVLSFEKAKMNMLEEKVNSMFELCKFRMFEPQKNGGEKPDCVTLVNGVTYNDLNTEGRINSGLDIINVLSKYNGLNVPVVIDNRESVSDIIKIDSQVINLVVDKSCKTLTIK